MLVGAGFATGQEVVQYFTSFGINGVWGIIIAGVIMTIAGTVFLQLGSYFHASEHNAVFRKVTHPIVSKLLDIAVIFTLFAVGFVMLAGAGSNMAQQFGWPAWVGSTLMLVLVLVTGLLDVDKVSNVIGLLTPTIIIAVIALLIYTLMNMPENTGEVIDIASQTEAPIGNWLLSAVNDNGLALILAVSMSLVIGGDHISPREAGWGGVTYAILLGISGFVLLMGADKIGDSDVPMLVLVNEMGSTAGFLMAIVIFLMSFNTAIGMFYALGKRLASGRENRTYPIFVVGTLAGYGMSFFGFTTLMNYVYPILGYMGMFMVVVRVFAWFRSLSKIRDESVRRERIKSLLRLKLHPEEKYDEKHDDVIGCELVESNLDHEVLFEDLVGEVTEELDSDSEIEFTADEIEEEITDVEYYIERDGVPDPVVDSDVANGKDSKAPDAAK
ncbi:MAG: YkvI family membrane protein [Corynebacterium casei]|uniref:YkvI family membrane protein n=1 Tax=Corynebacterium casei TaxID=160386 RepID=UPI003F8DF5BB